MLRVVGVIASVVAGVVTLGLIGSHLLPVPERQFLSALDTPANQGSLLDEITDRVTGGETVPRDIEEALVAPAPPQERIMNILVIGSDNRSGAGNTAYGSAQGQRSDSTLIVQVNPYADTTTVVSIPRDLWLRMPSCAGGRKAKFNSAFSLGGTNCTLTLVKTLTGLRFDHVVVVDFNAFKQGMHVLGGVDVCLNRALKDPQANLDLPAGTSRLTPEQALGLARSRHSTKSESDLARIDRQHYLLLRMAAESSTRVRDPLVAFRMLSALQPNLVVDQNFDTWTMAYLGLTVARTQLKTTTFPWRIGRSTPWGSVAVDVPRARVLIRALKDPQAAAASAEPTIAPSPSVSASSDEIAGAPQSSPTPALAASGAATESAGPPSIPCID